jgi:hypothetical protein
MANEPGVHVARGSIEEAWEATGEDFWIRLITDQIDDLDTVKAALAVADDAGPYEEVAFGSMDLVPAPRGFAVMIGPALWDEWVYPWVDRFASALQDRGMSGRLEGAVPEWGPSILDAAQQPVPALFARFTLPSTPGPMEQAPWDVPATQTREVIATVLDWALTEPGAVFADQESLNVRLIDPISLQEHVERVLRTSRSAGLDVIHPTSERARHAVLALRGNGLFQVVGRPWREAVEELTALAQELPPPLDLAFIRVAQRGIAGLDGLDSAQPLPGMGEHRVRENQHLLNRYLPDAHGVQIVNDAHLRAASDLSRWEIVDLGQNRYLVAAPDLDPWYGEGLPNPDVLQRARADWDGAILTEDIVAEHWQPPPGG